MCHSVGGRGIAGGEEPTRPWMLRTRVDGVVRQLREGELSPHAVRLHQSCGRKVQVLLPEPEGASRRSCLLVVVRGGAGAPCELGVVVVAVRTLKKPPGEKGATTTTDG